MNRHFQDKSEALIYYEGTTALFAYLVILALAGAKENSSAKQGGRFKKEAKAT